MSSRQHQKKEQKFEGNLKKNSFGMTSQRTRTGPIGDVRKTRDQISMA
jgi:hypothetical protein